MSNSLTPAPPSRWLRTGGEGIATNAGCSGKGRLSQVWEQVPILAPCSQIQAWTGLSWDLRFVCLHGAVLRLMQCLYHGGR